MTISPSNSVCKQWTETRENCVELVNAIRFNENNLHITLQEAKDIQAYFLRAGYISYEFDMPIHDFFKKLSAFIGKMGRNA